LAGGLHHVTHAVGDLDASAEVFRRLGFLVGARNRHAWGTHNRIVQLDGFYIELLEVAEPEKIVPHGERSFSFGAFSRDFLAHQQGLAMLALESRDAGADANAFRADGIGDFAPFAFERAGTRPDGSVAKVAFTLAFARDPHSPDAGFFACQEHFPENFWNPALQAHPNTAIAIAGVVLVAADPEAHRAFLGSFLGAGEAKATSSGFAVATPRGIIEVMPPDAFRARFGAAPPDSPRGAGIAALRFSVRDFGAAIAALKAGGVDAQMRMGRIVVAPQAAMGATLVFEPA